MMAFTSCKTACRFIFASTIFLVFSILSEKSSDSCPRKSEKLAETSDSIPVPLTAEAERIDLYSIILCPSKLYPEVIIIFAISSSVIQVGNSSISLPIFLSAI